MYGAAALGSKHTYICLSIPDSSSRSFVQFGETDEDDNGVGGGMVDLLLRWRNKHLEGPTSIANQSALNLKPINYNWKSIPSYWKTIHSYGKPINSKKN